MWELQQGQLRQEEMLRQAAQYRRLAELRSKSSHNYLKFAHSPVARTLIQVGMSLVRR